MADIWPSPTDKPGYALYGGQIFTEFEQKFLNRNTQPQISWRFCSQPIF